MKTRRVYFLLIPIAFVVVAFLAKTSSLKASDKAKDKVEMRFFVFKMEASNSQNPSKPFDGRILRFRLADRSGMAKPTTSQDVGNGLKYTYCIRSRGSEFPIEVDFLYQFESKSGIEKKLGLDKNIVIEKNDVTFQGPGTVNLILSDDARYGLFAIVDKIDD